VTILLRLLDEVSYDGSPVTGSRPADLLAAHRAARADGFEATRRIRAEADPGGARTPIVALTADALAGDRERCLACGMDDYMTKPVSTAQLAAAVQRWAGSAPAPG